MSENGNSNAAMLFRKINSGIYDEVRPLNSPTCNLDGFLPPPLICHFVSGSIMSLQKNNLKKICQLVLLISTVSLATLTIEFQGTATIYNLCAPTTFVNVQFPACGGFISHCPDNSGTQIIGPCTSTVEALLTFPPGEMVTLESPTVVQNTVQNGARCIIKNCHEMVGFGAETIGFIFKCVGNIDNNGCVIGVETWCASQQMCLSSDNYKYDCNSGGLQWHTTAAGCSQHSDIPVIDSSARNEQECELAARNLKKPYYTVPPTSDGGTLCDANGDCAFPIGCLMMTFTQYTSKGNTMTADCANGCIFYNPLCNDGHCFGEVGKLPMNGLQEVCRGPVPIGPGPGTLFECVYVLQITSLCTLSQLFLRVVGLVVHLPLLERCNDYGIIIMNIINVNVITNEITGGAGGPTDVSVGNAGKLDSCFIS